MKLIKTFPPVVAVVYSLFIAVNSVSGQSWKQTSAPDHLWASVASSSDGVKLAAAENDQGAGGWIYTSTNSGVDWVVTTAPFSYWTAIASSSDGSKLAATISARGIYTSTNSGATWTSNSAPFSGWTSVASSADGTKLVATASAYSNATWSGWIYFSTNGGANWILSDGPTAGREWSSVASSSDGSKMVAVDYYGVIYTSTNSGVAWMSNNAPSLNWWSVGSSADGSKLVAVDYSHEQIYTSTNAGTIWTSNNVPNQRWGAVASSSDGSKLVAAVFGGGIYTSTNSGATWISNSSPSLNWWSVASSADGSKLAAAATGNIYTWQAVPTLNLGMASVPGYTTNFPGSFQLSSTPGVTASPFSVVAADVNGDSNVDLIVGDTVNNTLEVFTNNGSDTFGPNAIYNVGGQPYSIAAADVNGDGKVDLIAVDYNGNGSGDGGLTVFTNNGNDGFVYSATLGGNGPYPHWLTAADVNNDGKMDLVMANLLAPSAIGVYINNGGSFTRNDYTIFSPGGQLSGVAVADVNGDGKLDLIGAGYDSNNNGYLTVLMNDGFGGFGSPYYYGLDTHPNSVTAADINGDGHPDLIAVNSTAGTLIVLTNNGTGIFGSNATYHVGANPYTVVAADVNGDGKLDLISADGGDTLTVLTNDGSGGFVLDATINVSPNAYSVAAADVNGDGRMDLIAADFNANTLTVLTNSPVTVTNAVGAFNISWASLSSANGYVLQTNSTLDRLNWVNAGWPVADDGTNRSITTVPQPGNLFFRLKQ